MQALWFATRCTRLIEGVLRGSPNLRLFEQLDSRFELNNRSAPNDAKPEGEEDCEKKVAEVVGAAEQEAARSGGTVLAALLRNLRVEVHRPGRWGVTL